ncbi:MAG: HTTM domain-containing protein [Acidobacteriales bacterium]|nr:HTTM domain-containing protein [Terriglobales bacterium]
MDKRPIAETLRRAWCLDLRSLALFRIGLALVVLGDLAARAQGEDLKAFYTDAGVLPRNALTARFAWPELWSFHLVSGTSAGQDWLFAIAAILAFLLLIGFHTRAATIAGWLMLLSLQARDPLILHGADVLLRLLFFWAIFLPLGKRYSVDSWGLKDDLGSEDELTVAPFWPSLTFAAQIAFVFLFTFLMKSGPEWRDGSAVSYALGLEQMGMPLGQWLRDFPALLRLITFGVLAVELAVPFLLFLPWKNGRLRTIGALAILAIQIGFGFTLRVGHFPFVTGIAAIALLPSSFWDRRSAPERITETGFPRLMSAFVAALLVYVLLWNVSTLGRGVRMPDRVQSLGRGLRLDQYWDMFSPSPVIPDGWYVMVGTQRNGGRVDAWRGRPFQESLWSYPGWRGLHDQYPTERWAVYLMDFHTDEGLGQRIQFGEYLCRRWNAGRSKDDPSMLMRIEIYFMQRQNVLDRRPDQPIVKKLVHQQQCGPR